MKLFRLSVLILLVFNHEVIADDLYQYTDKSGNMVISNKKTQGSRKFYIGTNEDARNKILEEELEHEKTAIKQINAMPEKKINAYNNDIALHQKNIAILTKQLNQE